MSFSEFHTYLVELAGAHDPETCRSPGHVVIEWNNELWCGPGGYWPELNEGIIWPKGDTKPLRGTFIRANEKRP